MPPPPPPPLLPVLKSDDVEISEDSESIAASDEGRPSWMKVKKISNKERRRRQNRHLRRLLTPKNAMMVLNEMLPKEQIISNTKSEFMPPSPFFKQNVPSQQAYSVELIIDGVVYKGFGESKVSARNSAAEQALRDIMIKKILKASNEGVSADTKHPGAEDDDTIPMIQLASYALHKLFSEWESDGHLVPLLRPPAAADAGAEAEAEAGRECGEAGAGAEGAGAEAAVAGEKRKRGKGGPKAKKAKVLPGNAGSMHPCMLLTYMRPALEYRDVAAEGDRPQNMLYTVALDVDGQTYLGKASNKREARKGAARSACLALFGVQFEPNASDTVPTF